LKTIGWWRQGWAGGRSLQPEPVIGLVVINKNGRAFYSLLFLRLFIRFLSVHQHSSDDRFFPLFSSSFLFMEMMRQERAGRWDGLCTRNHNGRRGGKGSHAIGPPNGQWLRRFHGPMLFRLQRRPAVAVAKRQRGYQIYPSNPPQSFVNTFEFYRIKLNS